MLANFGADQRMQQAFQPAAFPSITENPRAQRGAIKLPVVLQNLVTKTIDNGSQCRSEERRVGKECRL